MMSPEEYAKKQTELFEEYNVPQEMRGKLGYMAYERGHSSGYEEVLCVLRNYLDDLDSVITQFHQMKKDIDQYKQNIATLNKELEYMKSQAIKLQKERNITVE